MSETQIMRDILVALSALPDALFWRQNVGVARTEAGTVVRFGVPGMADIGGIYQGRSVQVEVKARRGKQHIQQRRWQTAVGRAGGIYIVARSVDEALSSLETLDPGGQV